MLTEHRRRVSIGDLRRRQFCGAPDQADGVIASGRMVHFYAHISGQNLCIRENLVNVVDGAAADFVLFQFFKPVGRWLFAHHIIENFSEGFAIVYASLVGHEALVTNQF